MVVLQTLSKAFGLAGIRLGMAIAHEDIIQLMNNVKAPYNVNKLTIDVSDDLKLYIISNFIAPIYKSKCFRLLRRHLTICRTSIEM